MELTPDWVVGFTDGKGCFQVSVVPNPKTSIGYQVIPEFIIVQQERDIQILYALKRFFRCGIIRRNHGDRWVFRVRKLSCLKEVCDFFTRHPLKTKKNIDLIRFRRIITKMDEGLHLTPEGLLDIIQIALRMNTGNREFLLRVREDILERFPKGDREPDRRDGPPHGESRGEG